MAEPSQTVQNLHPRRDSTHWPVVHQRVPGPVSSCAELFGVCVLGGSELPLPCSLFPSMDDLSPPARRTSLSCRELHISRGSTLITSTAPSAGACPAAGDRPAVTPGSAQTSKQALLASLLSHIWPCFLQESPPPQLLQHPFQVFPWGLGRGSSPRQSIGRAITPSSPAVCSRPVSWESPLCK